MVENNERITEFSYIGSRRRKIFQLDNQITLDLNSPEQVSEPVDEDNGLWRPINKEKNIFFGHQEEYLPNIEDWFNEIKEINKNKEDEHHIFFFSKGSEILVKNKSNNKLHPVVLNDSIAVKKDIKDQKTHIIWSFEKLGFASVYFMENTSYSAPSKKSSLVSKNWIVHKLDGQKEGIDYYDWNERIKNVDDLRKVIDKSKIY